MKRLNLPKLGLIGYSLLTLAVLVAFGLSGCTDARAQVVTDTVSWTWPTQRTDGAALPLSEIAKVTISWGTSTAGPFTNPRDVAPPATSTVFTRAAPVTGERCYVAAITDSEGRVSGQTGPVCKTVKAAPNAASGLNVT